EEEKGKLRSIENLINPSIPSVGSLWNKRRTLQREVFYCLVVPSVKNLIRKRLNRCSIDAYRIETKGYPGNFTVYAGSDPLN
ncbi:hypothetical protein NECAME_18505, partial [Necator americanus]